MLLRRWFISSVALFIPALQTSAQVAEDSQDSLVIRMNRFAKTYKEFVNEHNKGKFDVRLARKLSEQWRDVEDSGEWPSIKK